MDPERLKRIRIEPDERKPRRSKVAALFLVVGLATLALALLAWPRKEKVRTIGSLPAGNRSHSTPAGSTAQPTPAPTPAEAPAAAGQSVLTTSGYLINRERIELSPRMVGIVKWLGVRKGDRVRKGDVVVLLDDAEQRARVAESEAAVASAEQSLERARLHHRRIARLARDAVETEQQEEDARMAVSVLEAEKERAAAALATARTLLDWTVIRSPIDGVVMEKLVDENELVSPQSFGGERSPSTALVALADPADLQVEIDLNETDLGKVRLNQPCRISPEAYPDRTYDGYVAEIAPEASRQKGTLQVKVQIANPDAFLIPQLSAKVDFLAP